MTQHCNLGPQVTTFVGGDVNHPRQSLAVGAIVPLTIMQATDLGAGLTSNVAMTWIASFPGFIRVATVGAYDVTGTTTVDLYNSTTSTTMIAAQTVTDQTWASVTTIASATFAEGDVIQLRVTTAASTGACKGAGFTLTIVSTGDSSSNTYVGF